MSVYIALLVYLILVLFPVVHALPNNIDVLADNSLLAAVLATSTAVECSLDLFVSATRNFVRRERKCVTKIFAELGPYYMRRNYCMAATTFSKLHFLLQPYLLCGRR